MKALQTGGSTAILISAIKDICSEFGEHREEGTVRAAIQTKLGCRRQWGKEEQLASQSLLLLYSILCLEPNCLLGPGSFCISVVFEQQLYQCHGLVLWLGPSLHTKPQNPEKG